MLRKGGAHQRARSGERARASQELLEEAFGIVQRFRSAEKDEPSGAEAEEDGG